ncbi:hypothetical protein AR687_16505 [Flavobacteriaceae bacterium CRH]|nr:hypothetical protein AR687_16505 [Flavobacteriaceae bacterium CRH]
MAFYDYKKVLEISKTAVHKFYPSAACALLTGSQTEENFVSLVSDIDILIIDFELTGVSSEGMVYEGIKIDFSRVGIWNLADVLIESCYSKNNTIMNMIVIGHFINDALNLEVSLRQYCQQLYRNSNVNYFSEYQSIRRNLIMLRKHFSKELRIEEIPLTLSDFMLEISKAYLFFHHEGKYGLNGYRRSKLLHGTEKDLNFLKHINSLTQEYHIHKNGEGIIFQIERFLGYSLLNTKGVQDFRYVLSIDFGRHNSFIFLTAILEKIKDDLYLKDLFKFGCRAAANSVFPYDYVLIFESKDRLEDASVLKRLKELFRDVKGLKYKNVDAFWIEEVWFSRTNYLVVEEVFSAINNVAIAVVNGDIKYNYKKMIPIFIYVILRCKDAWGLSTQNIAQALNILRDKYRSSIYYQDIDHVKVFSNNLIIKSLDKVFLQNNVGIIEAYKQYIQKNIFFDEASEGFPVFKKLDNKISKANIKGLDFSTIPEFVQRIFQNEKTDNLYFLVTFFDFSLKSMGLNNNQFASVILLSLSAIGYED